MSAKILKTQQGKKRFVKARPLENPEDWLQAVNILKMELAQQSHFQLIGSKVYFEVSSLSPLKVSPLLEVIGVPPAVASVNFDVFDTQEATVLIHKVTEGDLFTMDWGKLSALCEATKVKLSTKWRLNELFYVVYDHAKIELHFFLQNDYIQNQF